MLTEADARTRLERLVAHTTPPTLSAEIVSLLLAGARADATGAVREGTDAEWKPGTAYADGDTVVPTSRNGLRYRVSVAGVSGAEEPAAWPASGTLVDGGVTWEIDTATPAAWSPTFDLAAAAAEGWRMKAGLVSDRFRFGDDGDSYDRNQVFEHCARMAELYDRKAAGGELVIGAPSAGAAGISSIPLSRGRRATLDADRVISLDQWNGSGPLPRVN